MEEEGREAGGREAGGGNESELDSPMVYVLKHTHPLSHPYLGPE